MNALEARRIYLHAITPLHSGIGQAVDVVDLPIAREKATGWPVIPGSSLKGTLRSGYDEQTAAKLFGTPESAGLVSLTDLRILCLPVRSFYGTFAWVTSPLVLERFARDGEALGAGVEWVVANSIVRDEVALVASGSLLTKEQVLYLEDLNLNALEDGNVTAIATGLAVEVFGNANDTFVQRFAIVSNTVFDFLCETATEITARIALGKDGTTSGEGGNLWYEEAVPAEAIFTGWLVETKSDTSGIDSLPAEQTIQIGGNATVGRGLCRLVVKKP
ncbi:MAG TPA: type III-B CRISPR module RAMP protein Cmr4 [Chthonomonadales bacterium]|nr:type III-B CRISPR module RAMP protein Cmr4 [Chthonomonadales bacterium]